MSEIDAREFGQLEAEVRQLQKDVTELREDVVHDELQGGDEQGHDIHDVTPFRALRSLVAGFPPCW